MSLDDIMDEDCFDTQTFIDIENMIEVTGIRRERELSMLG